jgi:CelD/BcsL family acetyltransferase involved in cellulose biosynthesis
MSFEWAQTLWETFPRCAPQVVIVAEDMGKVVGILPLSRSSASSTGIPYRQLVAIPDLCCRSGLLIRDADPGLLKAIMHHAFKHVPDWEALCIELVEDSPSHTALETLRRDGSVSARIMHSLKTPAIILPSDPEQYFATLSAGVRRNIKRYTEKKLGALGKVGIRFYDSEQDATEFVDAMLSIERRSWKEKAGTSITTNPSQEKLYRAFTPRAAKNGWLLSTVISINDEPIAYSYGFVFGNIFSQEKSSFDDKYSEYSPGLMVPVAVIRELCRRGIQVFDWMGIADEHKLRWGYTTYTRTSYLIFNNSIHGSLVKASLGANQRIRSMISSVRRKRSDVGASGATDSI